MERLLLWDIDGTLIRGGGAVSEAYRKALRAVYRLEGDLATIVYAGKTDGEIALETLARHGLAEEEVLCLLDSFRAAYVAELEAVRGRIAAELRVLPGVPAMLERLAGLAVHQTLLTGNFEPAARIKLSCGRLDHHFDFRIGAFGSDHRDRNCLVPVALEKAQRVHRARFSLSQVVVIGDTPRDIACARAAGVRVVTVATGTVTAAELAEHRPDALLQSLEDTEATLEAVLG